MHDQQHDGLTIRALKACRECTRSKQRCSGTAPCDRCNHRGLPCDFAKPSSEPSKDNAGEPQSGYLECSQIEDGDLSSHLHSLYPGSHAAIVGRNDPPTQYEFPWIPQDFAFPFASPFEIDPTITSDVMFYCDRTPLSFGDHTSFYLDESIASTPRQTKSGGTISTPERLADEPMGQRNPAIPMRVQSHQAELSFPGFPHFSPDDTDLLVSDGYCHVPEVSELDYDALLRLYHESVPASDSENKGNFPQREVINTFVQLYFEFFHSGFHLLHQATFQLRQKSSCLYLAVAAIGAQYSRVTSRGQCSLALLEVLRRTLLNNVGFFVLPFFLSL